MASTRNVMDTLKWVQTYINYQPVLIAGLEPALQSANMVLQTVLGPPFCWRWNRTTLSITTDTTHQDYTKASINDFGFIEKAWLAAPGNSDIKEIKVANCLSSSVESARPAYVAAQSDDGAGSFVFRYNCLPDVPYTGTVTYQKKPRLLTSVVNNWLPIPDEMSYIVDWGMLAYLSLIPNDPNWPLYNQKFISHLLGAQDGLDAMQVNIFLGNWGEVVKQTQRWQTQVGQGMAARQQ